MGSGASTDAEGIPATVTYNGTTEDENEEGIENLQRGMNLQEVLAYDPDGSFDFMFAGWSVSKGFLSFF